MKKRFAVAMLVFVLAAGAASANILTFRAGYFVPRLTGDFWDIEFDNMTYKKTSFQDATMGLNFELFLSRNFSLLLGLDVFRKNKAALYRDWVGLETNLGPYAFPAEEFRGQFQVKHSITVAYAPLQASFKWAPLGRRGTLIPYVGGGVNAMIWNVRMDGMLIDFNSPELFEDFYGQATVYPVYEVYARESDGLGRVSFGWQAFGGLMIPVGTRMTADVGAQYFSAPAEFKEAFVDFQPFTIGGFQIYLGINYWF